jgi:outer membrane lipoprotein SlyB
MDNTGEPADFMDQTKIWTSAGGALVTRIEFDSGSGACQFVEAITGDIEGSGVEEIVLRLQGSYLEIDLVPESNDICGDALMLAERMEEKLSETEFG